MCPPINWRINKNKRVSLSSCCDRNPTICRTFHLYFVTDCWCATRIPVAAAIIQPLIGAKPFPLSS